MYHLFSWGTVILSWIGTLILVLRGYPQAVKSIKDGHSDGLTPAMLWYWLLGSFLVLPHLILMGDFAVATIYVSNIFFVLIMIKYYYWPRKDS